MGETLSKLKLPLNLILHTVISIADLIRRKKGKKLAEMPDMISFLLKEIYNPLDFKYAGYTVDQIFDLERLAKQDIECIYVFVPYLYSSVKKVGFDYKLEKDEVLYVEWVNPKLSLCLPDRVRRHHIKGY